MAPQPHRREGESGRSPQYRGLWRHSGLGIAGFVVGLACTGHRGPHWWPKGDFNLQHFTRANRRWTVLRQHVLSKPTTMSVKVCSLVPCVRARRVGESAGCDVGLGLVCFANPPFWRLSSRDLRGRSEESFPVPCSWWNGRLSSVLLRESPKHAGFAEFDTGDRDGTGKATVSVQRSWRAGFSKSDARCFGAIDLHGRGSW